MVDKVVVIVEVEVVLNQVLDVYVKFDRIIFFVLISDDVWMVGTSVLDRIDCKGFE